jgi:hypothetical protein
VRVRAQVIREGQVVSQDPGLGVGHVLERVRGARVAQRPDSLGSGPAELIGRAPVASTIRSAVTRVPSSMASSRGPVKRALPSISVTAFDSARPWRPAAESPSVLVKVRSLMAGQSTPGELGLDPELRRVAPNTTARMYVLLVLWRRRLGPSSPENRAQAWHDSRREGRL